PGRHGRLPACGAVPGRTGPARTRDAGPGLHLPHVVCAGLFRSLAQPGGVVGRAVGLSEGSTVEEGRVTNADQALTALNRLFDRAVRLLGDSGRTDEACRLAAEGWSLLRHVAPAEADRLNGTLHWLTRPPTD